MQDLGCTVAQPDTRACTQGAGCVEEVWGKTSARVYDNRAFILTALMLRAKAAPDVGTRITERKMLLERITEAIVAGGPTHQKQLCRKQDV